MRNGLLLTMLVLVKVTLGVTSAFGFRPDVPPRLTFIYSS